MMRNLPRKRRKSATLSRTQTRTMFRISRLKASLAAGQKDLAYTAVSNITYQSPQRI